MATNKSLKGGTSLKVPEEAPIKHTAGGEMPDANHQHHVSRQDLDLDSNQRDLDSSKLESAEDFEEQAESVIEQIKGYLPLALSVVGVGIGGYLIYRLYERRKASFISEEEFSYEEGDFIADEGKRAQQVSNVQPSRLMGA